MPPPAEPSLWQWFAGGSYGEWGDAEEELWSFHVGIEKFSGVSSHAFYLEIGWSGDDDSFADPLAGGTEIPKIDVDVDFVPVTLNYKFERPLFGMERLHWYVGGGIGVLFGDLDIDYDAGAMGRSTGGSDEVFMGQLFAGLTFNLSDNFEIYGGGRWVWLDDIDEYDSDDDAAGEIGVRFNF